MAENKKDLKVENNGRDVETKEVSLGTDKYKLPYGLCAKYGIALPPNATPTDAWNALKGHGIKPSDVYKELQKEGDTDNIKPSDKKVVESKEKTKEELKKELSQKVVEDKTKEVGEKEVLKKSAKMLTEAEKAQLVKDFAHEQYPNTSFATMYDAKSDKSLTYTFNTAYGFNDEFTAFVDGKLGGEKKQEQKKSEIKRPNETFNQNAYSEERKNKANWFKGSDSMYKSQQAYTPILSNVWGGSQSKQKYAAIDYTAGSGGFNRPLRGYQNYWGKYNYKGVGNVDLDQEGKGDAIKALTEMIDKSSYNEDIWVQRGVDFYGAKQFLGLSGAITNEKAQSLIGKEFKDYGFQSTGASKGTGFTHNDCIFNIYCPAGTKMLYCAPFSHYGGSGISWDGKTAQGGYENEMLIQRQSTFRVTKAEQKGGTWYFDVEVTNQDIDDTIYKK